MLSSAAARLYGEVGPILALLDYLFPANLSQVLSVRFSYLLENTERYSMGCLRVQSHRPFLSVQLDAKLPLCQHHSVRIDASPFCGGCAALFLTVVHYMP